MNKMINNINHLFEEADELLEIDVRQIRKNAKEILSTYRKLEKVKNMANLSISACNNSNTAVQSSMTINPIERFVEMKETADHYMQLIESGIDEMALDKSISKRKVTTQPETDIEYYRQVLKAKYLDSEGKETLDICKSLYDKHPERIYLTQENVNRRYFYRDLDTAVDMFAVAFNHGEWGANAHYWFQEDSLAMFSQ